MCIPVAKELSSKMALQYIVQSIYSREEKAVWIKNLIFMWKWVYFFTDLRRHIGLQLSVFIYSILLRSSTQRQEELQSMLGQPIATFPESKLE